MVGFGFLTVFVIKKNSNMYNKISLQTNKKINEDHSRFFTITKPNNPKVKKQYSSCQSAPVPIRWLAAIAELSAETHAQKIMGPPKNVTISAANSQFGPSVNKIISYPNIVIRLPGIDAKLNSIKLLIKNGFTIDVLTDLFCDNSRINTNPTELNKN